VLHQPVMSGCSRMLTATPSTSAQVAQLVCC
jgi:hypothetical protein